MALRPEGGGLTLLGTAVVTSALATTRRLNACDARPPSSGTTRLLPTTTLPGRSRWAKTRLLAPALWVRTRRAEPALLSIPGPLAKSGLLTRPRLLTEPGLLTKS